MCHATGWEHEIRYTCRIGTVHHMLLLIGQHGKDSLLGVIVWGWRRAIGMGCSTKLDDNRVSSFVVTRRTTRLYKSMVDHIPQYEHSFALTGGIWYHETEEGADEHTLAGDHNSTASTVASWSSQSHIASGFDGSSSSTRPRHTHISNSYS